MWIDRLSIDNRLFPTVALISAIPLVLGACSLVGNEEILQASFWEDKAAESTHAADLGLASLFKGDQAAAEQHFDLALAKDPRNVYALIGAGMLYENTGQVTRAREVFETVRALRTPDRDRVMMWHAAGVLPVSEIAEERLEHLMDRHELGPAAGHAPAASAGEGVSEKQSRRQERPVGGQYFSAVGTDLLESTISPNVISRFATLRALRDQGLITPEEYSVRRQANLGALLPMSADVPAAGLERPVPDTEAIVARLHAIGRAIEKNAISVGQHASERSMILEALLPSKPSIKADPRPLPSDVLAAADTFRTLEKLQKEGFVSAKEYEKERAAIEARLTFPGAAPLNHPADPQKAATDAGAPVLLSKPRTLESEPVPVVHLASYRSREEAERGWSRLREAHQNLLGNLGVNISEVDLGAGKGRYYRIYAGPLASPGAAKRLCQSLAQVRQYCEQILIDMG